MPPLTERVLKVIGRLFPAAERETVRALLFEQVNETLPLVSNPNEIERIQLAALKLSGGDAGRFLEAAALAQMDWRDVLVAAGFGNDVEAHQEWAEKYTGSGEPE